MVQEYGVIKSLSLQVLIAEMDRLIGEGWQPLGGIAAVSAKFSASGEPLDSGFPGIQYVQAIVK